MMTCVDDVEGTVRERPDLDSVSHKMSQSQRALELRKFFAPWDPEIEKGDHTGYNKHLDGDGALNSYAENVVWRLNVDRAIISLVDVDIQYFLAGACRDDGEPPSTTTLGDDKAWAPAQQSNIPGAIYETDFTNITKKVMDLDKESDDGYPCLVIADLRQHPDTANLKIVSGEKFSYRFYAGAPIITSNDVPIGAFFVLCTDPRPEGLTPGQRKYLYKSAQNAMQHLLTKREADERRRVSMMSQGMAEFLERSSRVTEHDVHFTEVKNRKPTGRRKPKVGVGQSEDSAKEDMTTDVTKDNKDNNTEKTIDKIKLTLDHAASILKESLDLTVGGVVFLDTALGYRQSGVASAYFDVESDLGAATAEQAQRIDGEKGQDEKDAPTVTQQKESKSKQADSNSASLSPRHVRGFDDHIKPAKVLAMSKAQTVQWETDAKVIDGMTLQSLLNTYPQGNVWYYDDSGYFSSLDQANERDRQNDHSDDEDDDSQSEEQEKTSEYSATEGRNNEDGSLIERIDGGKKHKLKPTVELSVTQQQAEASLLLKVFEGARQIIFIPLWDAGNDRWHSGCFVWSKSAVPVFTVDSEIAYLAAFTNSVMVEISRLNALTANKMKSDFISSISHEFRSPLHGILASAEFLRESPLENTQSEFVATIQNCGSTLLDTINHVLDFSKINSFSQKSDSKGTILNELYEVSNVAMLCEDIVNGMIAANEYVGPPAMSRDHSDGILNDGVPTAEKRNKRQVDVILDIETRGWNFNIQPGALRRVIMNIFGNAQKYTSSGFILVQLRVSNNSENKFGRTKQQRMSPQDIKKILTLTIIDSGRGMSAEYMERKLYQPFAQEDTFATGVGLGLSIVHSIVTQLGGKIEIRSEEGKGTEVEVTLPLEDDENQDINLHDVTTSGVEAEQNMTAAKQFTAGKTFTILSHRQSSRYEHALLKNWECLKRYLIECFGMKFISIGDMQAAAQVSLVVMEQHDQDFSGLSEPFSELRSKLLVIRNHAAWHQDYRSGKSPLIKNDIWTPIGPYKLARVLLSLFTAKRPTFLKDTGRATSQDNSTQTDPNLISKSKSTSQLLTGETTPTPAPATNGGYLRAPHQNMPRTISDLSTLTLSDTKVVPISERVALAPISTPPPQISRQTSTNVAPILASGDTSLRLLAVDDNDLNLQLLTRFLKKRKCDQITMACNGLEAVNAVKALSEDHGQNFDVIFMDISMPVLDGFDATMHIRKYEIDCRVRRRSLQEDSNGLIGSPENIQSLDQILATTDSSTTIDIPQISTTSPIEAKAFSVSKCAGGKAYIVALTGLASRRDRDKAVEAGVDDFMTKPVQFTKVGELLKKICAEKAKEAGSV